ncbi:uncharacterized protein LOC119013489 isoform X4 [Acanthopagrus latus]|uniref:uncharacterized protein LOC119013489 isoform X4 n=1 Tax=Acanthopagrus latus TaxID=8177 RepID=UPI00187C7ADF|nr:uncharacterized protein LOC119013489 isoform X4 [Acanthopagrus latus]XP_036943966.1 uncharacterized protein LOC119013489 isoform X4 [Acanthopagrus latus]
MSFCEGVSVCPRCGGMRASTQVSRDLREQHRPTQPVMGAFETPLPFLSVPNQSVRNTSDDIRAALRTQRTAVSHMRRPLDLAEVRRIIESSDRTPENNQQLMEYIINKCPNAEIRESLKEGFQSLVILPLVDMYKFLLEKLKEKKTLGNTFDIIFVAHGEIDSFMFPANCLMPLPSIRDVVLYSPWNCVINADVAYGVATGSIQPHHRSFFCTPQQHCPYPDDDHQPTNLPNHWNSMSEAGGSRIPRIRLSPFREPKDAAWNDFVFLQDNLGEPGRNRVLVPFSRQGWMGSFDKIPFEIVTLVLSAVLEAFGCKATVHLAACLSGSEGAAVNKAELKWQYEYTEDNTMMGSSEERLRKRHNGLYKFFKDMFG